jgi:hypothetical protein
MPKRTHACPCEGENSGEQEEGGPSLVLQGTGSSRTTRSFSEALLGGRQLLAQVAFPLSEVMLRLLHRQCFQLLPNRSASDVPFRGIPVFVGSSHLVLPFWWSGLGPECVPPIPDPLVVRPIPVQS